MSVIVFPIRKVAVLGAGVMGAQIAAHLVNARVPVVLFDLAGEGRRPERHRREGDRRTCQARARAAGAARAALAQIDAANYDERPRATRGLRPRDRGDRRAHGLEARSLREDRAARRAACDLRIEHLRPVASATLAEALPAALRARFCGIHFFNPPRYMHLVELIARAGDRSGAPRRARDVPHDHARQGRHPREGHAELHRQPRRHLLDAGDDDAHRDLRARLRRRRCADRPGDRPRQERHLPHGRRRRPRHDGARDQDDARHAARRSRGTRCSATPPVLAALIAQGALGQKTRAGFFRKVGKDIQVLDPAARDYRAAAGESSTRRWPRSSTIKAPAEKFAKLRAHRRIRRRNSCGRSSATSSTTAPITSPTIADNARDVDLAMRWGFGWAMGPFETLAGGGLEATSPAGSAKTSPPARRSRRCRCRRGSPAQGRGGARRAHAGGRVLSAPRTRFVPRSTLPVYRRQLFPDPVLGERCAARARRSSRPTRCACGTLGDDIAHRVVQDARPTRSATAVLDGVQARDRRGRAGLRRRSSSGRRRSRSRSAPTSSVIAPAIAGRRNGRRSRTSSRSSSRRRCACATASCRRSRRCAAWRWAASCEFILHCDRAVAALESLHRAASKSASGCLPARRRLQGIRGARRATRRSAAPTAASSTCSRSCARISRRSRWRRSRKSALEAKELGYLRRADVVIMNAFELLYVAKRAGARAGRGGLSAAAAAAQRPGRRPHRHRDARDAARQHARRRLHLAVRLRGRAARSRACCAAAKSSRAAWSTRSGSSTLERARVHGAAATTRRRRSGSRTR